MTLTESLIGGLEGRALPRGGFSFFPGGSFRPDATAWAVIGLKSAGAREDLSHQGMDRLATEQTPDGSLVTFPDAPWAFWSTSLAALAWQGSEGHRGNMERAVEFLTKNPGKHWKKRKWHPTGHDPSIRGWSWTADTHSWVAPTSFGLLAFRAAGAAHHPSAEEAARMLMDRQLETGGWNYGNTSVYGTRLYPQPEQTGLVLSALRPYASRDEVSRSLVYLAAEAGRIATPLSLGWAILGMDAWGGRPQGYLRQAEECVRRQERTGPYDTQELSVLLLSVTGGLHE